MPTEPTPHRSDDELLALVRRKAAAIHYRRRVGALGAGALTLLLIAGGITLAGNGDNAKRTVHAAGAPTTTAVEEQTTTSEAPTTTTVVVAPPPSTTTTAKKRVPTTATATAGNPGQLQVSLTASPDEGPTATLVTFKLHVQDGRGGWDKSAIDFGDGSPGIARASIPGCAGPAPGEPPTTEAPPRPTDQTEEYHRGYRHPGTYTVKAQVETTTFCSPDPGTEDKSLEVTVHVLPGPQVSNGPNEPAGFLSTVPPNGRNPAFAYAYYTASDDDGYVNRVSLDWGDGKARDVTDYPLSDCHDPGTYWPRSNATSQDVGHQYAGPGTYTARLTITSVGCDGKDPQTFTTEAQVTYPAPPSG